MLFSESTRKRLDYVVVNEQVCPWCGIKGDGPHESRMKCIDALRSVIGEIMLYDNGTRRFGLHELYFGSYRESIMATRALLGRMLTVLTRIRDLAGRQPSLNGKTMIVLDQDLKKEIDDIFSFEKAPRKKPSPLRKRS
jgi:hypothetical protein